MLSCYVELRQSVLGVIDHGTDATSNVDGFVVVIASKRVFDLIFLLSANLLDLFLSVLALLFEKNSFHNF